MTPDDIIKYLGMAHVPGGTGPDQWDCWNFLRYLEETYFDVVLPIAPIGDEAACRAIFKEKCETGQWLQVSIPQHGDCALMRGGSYPHVGMYLDFDGGGIIHAMEKVGVIWTRLQILHSIGFGRTTYYRVVK